MFSYGIMVEDIVEAFDMRSFHAKKGLKKFFQNYFISQLILKCEITAIKYLT